MANPLEYPSHRSSLEEHKAFIYTAIKHRIAVILYSDSRRVLEAKKYRIIISTREYYNTMRKIIPNSVMPKTVNRLLVTLEEEGFIYRIRVKEKLNEKDKPI
jgi:Fe2+ or Zn2+ uptake regulation protein